MDTAARRPLRIPLTAWLLGLPGVVCLIAGLVVLAIDLDEVHPLLGDTASAIALIVSAIALLGSAAFPVVFARLADREMQQRGSASRAPCKH